MGILTGSRTSVGPLQSVGTTVANVCSRWNAPNCHITTAGSCRTQLIASGSENKSVQKSQDNFPDERGTASIRGCLVHKLFKKSSFIDLKLDEEPRFAAAGRRPAVVCCWCTKYWHILLSQCSLVPIAYQSSSVECRCCRQSATTAYQPNTGDRTRASPATATRDNFEQLHSPAWANTQRSSTL